MKRWEKKLREQLEKEVANGAHDISGPMSDGLTFVGYTGKQGKIEQIVSFERMKRDVQAEMLIILRRHQRNTEPGSNRLLPPGK